MKKNFRARIYAYNVNFMTDKNHWARNKEYFTLQKKNLF